MIRKDHHSKRYLIVGILALISIAAIGCGPTIPTWEKGNSNDEVYTIATRKLPPEPVYNPVRWVRPPEVTPERKVRTRKAPLLMPIIHLDIENTPLSEAGRILSAVGRYRSYCSSLVAQKKVTINALGTMDELGKQISEKSGAKVIVDHQNREVRILAENFVAPKF